jgi:hypothetical protein
MRTCGVDGCPKPHRARGLCVTHYNKRFQPNRHRKVTVACGWCGQDCAKAPTARFAVRFCSLACRDYRRHHDDPTSMERARAAARAARSTPRARARRKLARAARGSRGRTAWVAGRCGRCRETFVAVPNAALDRYCSTACKNRQKASRRRARARGAAHEPYSRVAVFQRDRWRCHLCRKLVKRNASVPHPLAPVIDHLVPLGSGPDAMHNVATAHHLCNSTRREVGAAQLLLFGDTA